MLHLSHVFFIQFCSIIFLSMFLFASNYYGLSFVSAQNMAFSPTNNDTFTSDIQNEIDKVIGNTWSKLMEDTISITTSNSKPSDNPVNVQGSEYFNGQNDLSDLSDLNKIPNLINTNDILKEMNNISTENENSHENYTYQNNSDNFVSVTSLNEKHLQKEEIDLKPEIITNKTEIMQYSNTENKNDNKSSLLPQIDEKVNYEKNSSWNPFNDLSNYFGNLFNNPCN